MVKTDLADVALFGPLQPVDVAASRARLCGGPGVPGFVEVEFELRRVAVGRAATSGKGRDVKIAALGGGVRTRANYG